MTSWLSARGCKFLCADRLCKVRLCATKELALCLDLILGRRIWCVVRADLLSSMELALWLCAQEQMNVRRLKTNKEEEEVGGRSPTLG
jgi:hypothetical protein